MGAAPTTPTTTTGTVTVTTTYLHLPDRTAFRPAFSDNPDLSVVQAREPLVPFYRFLYRTVGEGVTWTERLKWSDAQLGAYLALPTTTLFVLHYRGTPAGYVELDTASEEPDTEIAYFGLFAAFRGRGFGKHFFSWGVQRAFDEGAGRVWLHTCTLDSPIALVNYRARGFVPYRTTTQDEAIEQGEQGE